MTKEQAADYLREVAKEIEGLESDSQVRITIDAPIRECPPSSDGFRRYEHTGERTLTVTWVA